MAVCLCLLALPRSLLALSLFCERSPPCVSVHSYPLRGYGYGYGYGYGGMVVVAAQAASAVPRGCCGVCQPVLAPR